MLSESAEVVPTTQYPNSLTAGTTWLPTVIFGSLLLVGHLDSWTSPSTDQWSSAQRGSSGVVKVSIRWPARDDVVRHREG